MEKIYVQTMAWYTGWGQGVWGTDHRPPTRWAPNATHEGRAFGPRREGPGEKGAGLRPAREGAEGEGEEKGERLARGGGGP